MDAAKKTMETASAAGMGQTPVTLNHPIHPATVHFPITLMSGAFTLDALQTFTPSIFPKSGAATNFLTKFIPPAHLISPAAYYLGGAGVAFSLISISTGLAELYGLWKNVAQEKGGWIPALKAAYTSDSKDVGATKLKTTLTHASMNDITVGLAAYNTYKRGQSATLSLPKINAYFAVAVLPLFFYSAYLGAALVYEMGVGVMRQGEGLEYKKLQEGKKQ